jgi:exodeoxyribonuclease VII small subunit
MKYQEAIDALKKIAQQIETEELTLDEIEVLLAKAKELTQLCRASLRRVNDQLNDFQAN